ncbi:MAG: hypothetical protein KUG79_02555 [Pseudomonadales bacterium]|nr:hypothetical protein [Pseudomonadales bacterium]
MPIENCQWMVTLNGRKGDVPPLDQAGFTAYAKSLPATAVYDRLNRSKLVGRLKRFIIAQSYWRHYEQMATFPSNIIPIGDAVAGFNPVFGQGMSAAAVDAHELKKCLHQRATSSDNLAGLHHDYFNAIQDTVSAAWNGTAIYDMMYDSTQGTRPDDFPQRKAAFLAMQELADADPAIRLKRLLIGNMLEPGSSLYTEEVLEQLQTKMASMAG